MMSIFFVAVDTMMTASSVKVSYIGSYFSAVDSFRVGENFNTSND